MLGFQGDPPVGEETEIIQSAKGCGIVVLLADGPLQDIYLHVGCFFGQPAG